MNIIEIRTSNYIACRLDDLSHFGELNNKQWVSVESLEDYCLSKLSEKITTALQGDWNEAFKLIIEELKKQEVKK